MTNNREPGGAKSKNEPHATGAISFSGGLNSRVSSNVAGGTRIDMLHFIAVKQGFQMALFRKIRFAAQWLGVTRVTR